MGFVVTIGQRAREGFLNTGRKGLEQRGGKRRGYLLRAKRMRQQWRKLELTLRSEAEGGHMAEYGQEGDLRVRVGGYLLLPAGVGEGLEEGANTWAPLGPTAATLGPAGEPAYQEGRVGDRPLPSGE